MNRKVRVGTLAAIAIAAAVVGLLGAWSGAVPLSAKEGHWAITRWFLHYTMKRTVKVRSSFVEPPRLGDPALVMRGAGHFESGCKPCHGAPGAPRPVTLRHMTPLPPWLPDRIPEWNPEELFWIVDNGVKFTGMPGWPAPQREDEIWSMVAFLQELPTMSVDEYRRLAFGPDVLLAADGRSPLTELPTEPTEPTEDAPLEALTSCARCHGARGRGRLAGAFPKLAGQSETYLAAALESYAAGERPSGIMEPVAAALTDEAKLRLARYYGSQEGLGSPVVEVVEANGGWSRGERIAREGIPELRVPACSDCHGPSATPRRAIYPELAGQDAAYLVQQLELFKSGERGGSPFAHLMDPVVDRMPAEAIPDVADYYASLGARSLEEPAREPR